MNIEIKKASIEEKSILRNLLELYQYDFSEFDGSDIDEHGLFGYKYLDHYWTEDNRYPFIIRVNGKLAGFVLVRDLINTDNTITHCISEFFIMRKYRRQGIGKTVAQKVFDMFPGYWSVAQIEQNIPAQNFWRKVISEYTKGNYREIYQNDDNWVGPIQLFLSKGTHNDTINNNFNCANNDKID